MVLSVKKKLCFNFNLNLEGHLNRFIGSKVTTILVNGGILPSGGIAGFLLLYIFLNLFKQKLRQACQRRVGWGGGQGLFWTMAVFFLGWLPLSH